MGAFFSPGGVLEQNAPGYACRPDQQSYAEAVAAAMEAGGVLVAEAATGTGKTLAYLLPALLSNKKVVVSTATKTLQTQIVEREAKLLTRVLGRPVSAALLKGRENYLCVRRNNFV